MFSANKCVIKMSNTVKDIDTKNGNTTFSMILSITKILIQTILK